MSRDALFTLCTPSTSAQIREDVESMLAAEEKVWAKKIIAMRKSAKA